MRVLILGCGPAGLFAAHAATELGATVEIHSNKRRSEMFGAQYLHTTIPGLTDVDGFTVEYALEGDLLAYLHKVYGDELPDNVTVNSLVGKYPAWDIRAAYNRAWTLYRDNIVHTPEIKPIWIGEKYGSFPRFNYDAIISTIPAADLCVRPRAHSFSVREVWAVGDAPERGVFAPRLAEPNQILYDGTRHRGWYRASLIADYAAVEWPAESRPPMENVSSVAKPIRTNCDCPGGYFGPRFIPVGRYGAWSRFGHSHQAYWTVKAKLKELL